MGLIPSAGSGVNCRALHRGRTEAATSSFLSKVVNLLDFIRYLLRQNLRNRSHTELFEIIKLDNGLTLEIWDESRKIAENIVRVVLTARIKVALNQEYLPNREHYETVCRAFGDELFDLNYNPPPLQLLQYFQNFIQLISLNPRQYYLQSFYFLFGRDVGLVVIKGLVAVAFALAVLGHHDHRGRVGGLHGEEQVQENEGIWVPVIEISHNVHDHPDQDQN